MPHWPTALTNPHWPTRHEPVSFIKKKHKTSIVWSLTLLTFAHKSVQNYQKAELQTTHYQKLANQGKHANLQTYMQQGLVYRTKEMHDVVSKWLQLKARIQSIRSENGTTKGRHAEGFSTWQERNSNVKTLSKLRNTFHLAPDIIKNLN